MLGSQVKEKQHFHIYHDKEKELKICEAEEENNHERWFGYWLVNWTKSISLQKHEDFY